MDPRDASASKNHRHSPVKNQKLTHTKCFKSLSNLAHLKTTGTVLDLMCRGTPCIQHLRFWFWKLTFSRDPSFICALGVVETTMLSYNVSKLIFIAFFRQFSPRARSVSPISPVNRWRLDSGAQHIDIDIDITSIREGLRKIIKFAMLAANVLKQKS